MPPHDLDAENSVLGAMLLDPTAISRVLETLRPEDFYRENNAQIYRAAISLFQAGEPIDNVTLAAALERQGVLERVGGRAQLALLAEGVPTAANVEYYGRIVKSKAIKRKLIRAGGDVAAIGFDEAIGADDALNRAEKAVFDVAEERVSSAMSKLYELLRPAMDRIDAQMSSGNAVVGIPSGFYDLDNLTSGFKPSDLIVVAGRPAMGKCMTAGTLIDDPTSGARLTIEEFVRGRLPMVWGISRDGTVRATEVGGWVDSGVQPAFRVRTRTGRTVEVTGHHPFLTVRGWQPLHEIRLGDRIAVPRQLPCFGDERSLALDQVRLLAYLLVAGLLTAGSPGLSSTDPRLVDDFKRILAARHPRLSVHRQGRSAYVASHDSPASPEGSEEVAGNSLRRWLDEMGLWGQPAEARRFPDCVWRWDRPRLQEFVGALFGCVGGIARRADHPRAGLSVASRGLAEDIQHALTRCGVVSNLSSNARWWCVQVTEAQSLTARRTQAEGLSARASSFSGIQASARAGSGASGAVALADGERPAAGRSFTAQAVAAPTTRPGGAPAVAMDDARLRRLANPDLHWDEVVGIDPVGRQQVYDLTVPDGANFIAQDVVVHNTSFLLNLCLHAAVERQVPVAVFSLEMSKEQLVERLLCQQARIDSQRMHRGMLSEAEYERLVMAIGPLENAPIFIDDSPVLDELTLLLKARQAKLRESIGMIVLDYLQLMQGRGGRGDEFNRVQEVSSISRSLKALARELKVPVVAISQLSRAPEARPNKRPMLSDLRESGSIEQDSDIVLFLYRDEYYNPNTDAPGIAEVNIAKHRNGPTDTIKLRFRKDQTLFYNLESRRPESEPV